MLLPRGQRAGEDSGSAGAGVRGRPLWQTALSPDRQSAPSTRPLSCPGPGQVEEDWAWGRFGRRPSYGEGLNCVLPPNSCVEALTPNTLKCGRVGHRVIVDIIS